MTNSQKNSVDSKDKESSYKFFYLKAQFPKRICKCPSIRKVDFCDETRRICGLSNRAEITNPTSEDIKKAIYILKKFRNIGDLQNEY